MTDAPRKATRKPISPARRTVNIGMPVSVDFEKDASLPLSERGQVKGILKVAGIERPSRGPETELGKLSLGYITAQTDSNHSDVLRNNGFEVGTQPYSEVPFGGRRFFVAGRYTYEQTNNLLRMNLQLGARGGDVAEIPAYEDFRWKLAIGGGQAILRDINADPETTNVGLIVVNNFNNFELGINNQTFVAANIAQLSDQLKPQQ